jgi:hypothetical protein
MLMSAHALLLDQEASLDFYSTKNMYKFGDKTHQTWKHKKLSFTKKKMYQFCDKNTPTKNIKLKVKFYKNTISPTNKNNYGSSSSVLKLFNYWFFHLEKA